MTKILESDKATKRHDKKCLRVSESHVKNANGHAGNYCRMASDTMDKEESGEFNSPIIEERRRFVKNDSSPFF